MTSSPEWLAPEQQVFGRGFYTAADMRRLVGLDAPGFLGPSKVSRWLGALAPSGRLGTRAYTFYDLISLLVVTNLRKRGFTLRTIADAERHLKDTLGVPYPLATEWLATSGADILYRGRPRVAEQLTAANRGGQEVFVRAIEQATRRVRYADSWAVRWDLADGVAVDPNVQFGDPCIAETAILTAHVARQAASGRDAAGLARDYGLRQAQIRCAIRFEDALTAA
jgi:uncharacterized protein (DUF433 family)